MNRLNKIIDTRYGKFNVPHLMPDETAIQIIESSHFRHNWLYGDGKVADPDRSYQLHHITKAPMTMMERFIQFGSQAIYTVQGWL